MASVEITISGVLYDKLNRTTQQVVLIGEASLTGLGVGGGPIIPPGQPVSPGVPTHPIMLPGMPGWGDPHPAHPIVLPPELPPGVQPPVPPKPGDPTTPVPPPAGTAGWPVNPIVVPDYIVVWYPGVGPVYVAPPQQGPTTTPPAKK